MATDTSKVYAGSSPKGKGIFYRAPEGTTLPTGATTALSAAYEYQGGNSEAGYTNKQERTSQKIRDHDGEVVANLQSEYTETFTIEVIESRNTPTLKTIYGDDNVTITPATSSSGEEVLVRHNEVVLPRSVFVFDTVYGKGKRRQCIPLGQVTEVGDVTFVSKDIVKYPLTIECYKYFDGANADYVLDWINDGIVAGS
ncbi:phage tail tube protein [Rhodococcus erythropolis]|uniref:phage tail tube protein n=1 Tax=Rhodococcus erythropolis TaxID=1833 RepID=UPI001BE81292|nr:hypothetical protein [Rhodococcus erythropolis]MBT2266454.1 hypothetical protein [Rhodococcus erythropolis]